MNHTDSLSNIGILSLSERALNELLLEQNVHSQNVELVVANVNALKAAGTIVIVSGAGTDEVNGFYQPVRMTLNERPQYEKADDSTYKIYLHRHHGGHGYGD
eukprot:SAG31_NODE_13785_length_847_cov_1.037433_1_plen_101_part_01